MQKVTALLLQIIWFMRLRHCCIQEAFRGYLLFLTYVWAACISWKEDSGIIFWKHSGPCRVRKSVFR